jgi:hypothetical protein
MSHDLKAVAAMPGWNGGFGIGEPKQLLSVVMLTIALLGCGSQASRDVLVHDACITRHPQEMALCEGPRQGYQLDQPRFSPEQWLPLARWLIATRSSGRGGDHGEHVRDRVG